MGTHFGLAFEYDATLFTKRGHVKIVALAMRQLARRHKRRVDERHFANNPDTRPGGGYGYAPRSKGWQITKAKEVGQVKPLVYTGGLKAAVASSSRITATSNTWTYRARGSFPMNDQRRAELQAVTPAERQEDAKLLAFLYQRAAKSPVFHEHQRHRTAGAGRKAKG